MWVIELCYEQHLFTASTLLPGHSKTNRESYSSDHRNSRYYHNGKKLFLKAFVYHLSLSYWVQKTKASILFQTSNCIPSGTCYYFSKHLLGIGIRLSDSRPFWGYDGGILKYWTFKKMTPPFSLVHVIRAWTYLTTLCLLMELNEWCIGEPD